MTSKLTALPPLELSGDDEVRLHRDGDRVIFDLCPVRPFGRDDLIKLRDWLNLVLADSAGEA